PKDIGLIIQHLDISPGKVVLEIGTGSGALSISIANLVKPGGHLYTYEAKKRFAEMAQRNIRRAGLGDYVTIINRDAKSGIEVDAVDAVSIDVGDPWEIIPVVSEPLRLGSPLCSFSPTVNQVEKTVESLRSLGFVDISTLECFVRHMRVEAGKTRPATTMISHTGYLTFARRGEMP
ncbi:methyltransferase, partial [Candidatus Bathyarchaeota archaeon]|nr:methyltransferase [Candidatus Bathyarchaeota archaeon]